MSNFKRLLADLPVGPLLAKLAEHPALWGAMTIRQDFEGSPHRDTRCIVLNGPRTLDPVAAMSDTTSMPYMPAWGLLSGAASPLLAALCEAIGVTDASAVGRIMLVELAAGGEIAPHRDEGLYAKTFSRFHICLSGASRFRCGENSETWWAMVQPGSAWWFNHRETHAVTNIGGAPRVHLIVDAVSPLFPVDQAGD